MSLADLVPVIASTRMERRRLTNTEKHMRWLAKNRSAFNAYRREWWRLRKLK